MSTPGGLQRQFYDMLMESQWWPADDLRDYQRGQLGQLLRHAKKNVPFYAERLDAVLKPNGDIDWDKWGEIPIVKRQDMVEHREAMQAKELPPGHGPTGTQRSSGSTGIPIVLTSTALNRLVSNALRLRVQTWHELDWSRIFLNGLGDPWRPDDWPQGTPLGPWGPSWVAESSAGFAWSLNSRTPRDVVLDFIERRNCDYLVSGPKTSHLLALESLRLDKPRRLKAILAQSNAVGEDDRRICQTVFGAPLIEHYSSKEGGQTAHECPNGTLHLNGEAVLVEIIDESGAPCPAGVAGRVILTPFFNTAQPLIRYEVGDMAIPGEPCSCGRTSHTLERILGRQLAIFRHPDGRGIINIIPDSARDLLQCQFWQMAQIGPNDYEVRYVPRDRGAHGDEPAFTELFRATFFADAEVRYSRVAEIPLTAASKLIEYINEYHRAGN